jgi:glycine betaine/proline transport system ATP-binding protein
MRDVARIIRSGERSLEKIIPLEDVAKVSPDTLLADCLIPSAESRVPIAVVDDDGRLLGVIPRVTLLSALGGNDANNETEQETGKNLASANASEETEVM